MADHPLKTTKDLLQEVEQQRATDTEGNAEAPAAHNATTAPPKRLSLASYLSKKDERKKELDEMRAKEEEQKHKEEQDALRKQEEVKLQDEARVTEGENFVNGQNLKEGASEAVTKIQQEANNKPAEQMRGKEECNTAINTASSQATQSDTVPNVISEPQPLLSSESSEKSEITEIQSTIPTDEKPSVQGVVDAIVRDPKNTAISEEDSDDEIRVGSNRESSVAQDEDSDAETVYSGSPQKPKRLLRGNDISLSKAIPRLKLEDDNEADVESVDNSTQNTEPAPRQHFKTRKHTTDGGVDLHEAAKGGDLERVKELIEAGDEVEPQDNAGYTPLLIAALGGETDVVAYLIEKGADVNHTNVFGDTPLIVAAPNTHIETVQVLLNNGANPFLEDSQGDTALDGLYQLNNDSPKVERLMETLRAASEQYLREHPDYSSQNTSKQIEHANDTQRSKSRYGRDRDHAPEDDSVEYFTEQCRIGNFSYVGQRLQSLGTRVQPLSVAMAARFGHGDVVNLLLALGRPNINARMENGQTILMRAVGRGHLEIVKVLLENGAKVNQKTSNGRTALDFAEHSFWRDEEEIALLLQSGAKQDTAKSKTQKRVLSNSSHATEPVLKRAKLQTQKTSKATKVKNTSFQTTRPHSTYGSESESNEDETVPSHAQSKKDVAPTPRETIEERQQRLQNDTFRKEKEPFRLKQEEEIHEAHLIREAQEAALREKSEKEKQEARLKKEEEERAAREKKHREDEAVRLKREDEERRAATIKREKDLQEQKEYAARHKAAMRKRQQSLLNDLEQQEELQAKLRQKLEQEEEERRKIVEEAKEMKLKEDLRQKELMSRQGENERREKIREQYPTGLKRASFSGMARAKEEMLEFLPLYTTLIDDVEYLIDLQVIMMLGLDDFDERYSSYFTEKRALTDVEKKMTFGFLQGMLCLRTQGDSTQQLISQAVEFGRYMRCQVHWLKLDDFYKLINEDFRDIDAMIRSHRARIILDPRAIPSHLLQGPGLYRSSSAQPGSRVVSSGSVPVLKRKLPLLLRRKDVYKTLSRNSPLWGTTPLQ